jgi:hypothetical protein
VDPAKGGQPNDPAFKPPPSLKKEAKKGIYPYGQGDDPMWESHPYVMHWLCDRSWNQRDIRELPRVSIQATRHGFTLTMSAYAEAKKAPIRCRHLGELFDALEAFLRDPDAAWEDLTVGSGAQFLKGERKKLDKGEEDE